MVKVRLEEMESFNVIGIFIRTKNEEGHADQQIPKLWNRFWEEEIIKKIPQRTEDTIYAVYTDYESDFRGSYTFLIGCKVPENTPIPDGMIEREIPAQKYVVYTAKGNYPESLIDTWGEIWGSQTPRAYSADFEVYNEDFTGDQNSKVDVYVALKSAD